MNENMNDDLQKFEEIEALISVEEKGAHEDEKGAPSIFMTDIRFKEAVEAGDLLDEAAFAALDAEDQKGYEMVNVMNEETKEPMGWMFRFKADDEAEDAEAEDEAEDAEVTEDAADEENEEKVDDTSEVDEKTAMIVSMMRPKTSDAPSIFLTDARFKEMEEEEALINDEQYEGLDEDAKEAYEQVDVYEEGTGKGYGMRYRRRSPLELNSMRKGNGMEGEKADQAELEAKADDADADKDMFDSEEEALERAAALGCEGTHRAGEKFMPCGTHDEWMKLSANAKPEEETEEAEEAAPAEGKSEDFMCGFQRKSVAQPCEFCQGGCAPEDGLPGLADIETIVKTAHAGEILGSGYSATDDMFVVDVKRADGSCIEVFLTGEGDELGWLRVDEQLIEGKSAEELNIISKDDAEAAAVASFTGLDVKEAGEVMGVMVDIFGDEDVYVVEIDAESKSYDFYVSVEGKVLGYDEYDLMDDFQYDMSEEDEIKALEAELEIKRMYSREQREAMAETGEAMEDGSFPIADEADLSNAIQSVQRAKDVDAAKVHIAKRAKELGLEDMLPDGFVSNSSPVPAAENAPAPAPEEKHDSDADIISAMEEFRSLMEDGLS